MTIQELLQADTSLAAVKMGPKKTAAMYARGEGVKKDIDQAKLYLDEAEYMGLDVSKARATAGL